MMQSADGKASEGYYVLGLDPGTNACGWCLLDTANKKIVGLGVHEFDCPQDPKSKVSLARKRRGYHYARVNRRRTKYRAKHVLAVLKKNGLVPKGETSAWLQSRKGDVPVMRLRADAIERRLTGRELAQVLYFFALHRGYDVKRSAEEDDGKKILKAIADNQKAMDDGRYFTVGQMLEREGRMRNRDGDYRYMVSREMVLDEVEFILGCQAAMRLDEFGGEGSICGKDDLWQEYLDALAFERSSAKKDAADYARVGACVYFPGEKRAASANVTSEMLSALERFKHLRIVKEDGSDHALSPKQANAYVESLFSANGVGKIRYSDIRRDLDMPSTWFFKGVDSESEKREVYEPKAWRSLVKALPQSLLEKMKRDTDFGDDVCEALTYASSEPVLVDRLVLAGDKLTNREIDALCACPYTTKVFSGYGSRSRKAIGILLDALKDDDVPTLFAAEEDTGLLALRRVSGAAPERSDKLPPYDAYDPTCTNPVVLRSVSRMRKVVNAVCARWGVPNEIHIELGRDLKRSRRERMQIAKANALRRRDNETSAKLAAQALACSPEEVPPAVLKKVALWMEQGEACAYTGAHIDFTRMCAETGYVHVSHILPYSRTGDDGAMNKVLALAKPAQDKAERSPYEWMTSGEVGAPEWEAFAARVRASKLPVRKRQCLLEVDLSSKEDRLLARHLSDTRYMSRAFKSYLDDCLLFPGGCRRQNTLAVSGMATGLMRRIWGLNSIPVRTEDGGLDYSDKRYLAVNAAVVAACNADALKRCARYSETKLYLPPEERDAVLADTQPWKTFGAQLRALYAFVKPTRAVSRKVSGEALEQTNRGVVEVDPETGFAKLTGFGRLAGNYQVLENGTVRMVSGMAYLRLWYDPDAEPKGKRKGRGRYYAEPVYYNDIPHAEKPDYTPRYPQKGTARTCWPAVPDAARRSVPIIVFPNSVIEARGERARFKSFMISNNKWLVESLDPRAASHGQGCDFPTLASLCGDDRLKVITESVLGSIVGESR